MSKGEWTPGPWVATPDPDGAQDDYCIGIGERIDLVAVCSKRDARLIAAAPELVEALQSARSYVVAELEAELERMRGYEHLGRLGEITADLAEIDAALTRAGAL